MSDNPPIFRFAPSPNGELHLGHAYSALLNLQLARAADGKILLRIEDIDTTRCTPQLEKQMLENLEWIGFEWDETPRRQSEHFDDHHEALFELERKGLVYASNMTRGQIRKFVSKFEEAGEEWPRDPDGSPLYPGIEKSTKTIEQHSMAKLIETKPIRLNMTKAMSGKMDNLSWKEFDVTGDETAVTAKPDNWGDVVLSRRDTPTSYHLACVVDDHLQGVTHIVRGTDLYHSTSVHRLLQELLEFRQPSYHHHDLIFDNESRKLSKSDGSTSLKQLREKGYSAADIRRLIGLYQR